MKNKYRGLGFSGMKSPGQTPQNEVAGNLSSTLCSTVAMYSLFHYMNSPMVLCIVFCFPKDYYVR